VAIEEPKKLSDATSAACLTLAKSFAFNILQGKNGISTTDQPGSDIARGSGGKVLPPIDKGLPNCREGQQTQLGTQFPSSELVKGAPRHKCDIVVGEFVQPLWPVQPVISAFDFGPK